MSDTQKTDPQKANSPQQHPDARGAKPARTSFSLTTLGLGCLVIALITVLVIIIVTPPQDVITQQPGPEFEPADMTSPQQDAPAANGTAAADPADAGEPAVGRAPASTIQLTTIALPASVEQLQGEAEQVANVLRQQYPDLAQALHVVAMLDSQIKKSGEAEKLWRQCIDLDPKQVTYYVNLAAIAMDRGNSQLAADTLQMAIDAGLSNPDVQHHLAVALTKLGRCEEAEVIIQKALTTNAQNAAYWTVLGQAQLKLSKLAEAEVSLKKALQLGTRTANIYFALGNALARQQKTEEAAEYRELFQAMKETKPLDKQQRFQILSTAEARRTAVTILCEAAAVHRQQQNSLESERLLMRAVVLDPATTAPCNMLAELYQQSGMLAEERVVRQRLIELEPLRLVNYLLLAKLCVDLHEPEKAEATLKMALAIRPQAIETFATLAQFYLEQGKAGQARWYAQEAIRRQPSVEGYQFLSVTCKAMGDNAAADAALAMANSLQAAGPRQE